jgi:outer membrane protein TolC
MELVEGHDPSGLILRLARVSTPTGGGGDHPDLRLRRLELAVSEARLRALAARAWPGLRLGPHLGFPSGGADPLRVGGLVSLSLPFPSSYAGRLEAAAARRDRALERYSETLLGLRTRERAADERSSLARERREVHATQVERATAGAWTATRAAFRVGRAELVDWIDALERRKATLNVVLEADLVLARASLELASARGPRMEDVR